MTTAPRRVTLVLTSPGWRGSGVSFLKIASGLSHRGHEVRFVAGDQAVGDRLAHSGLPVDLVLTGDTGRREVEEVRRLFRAHAPQVVICDAPRDVRIARYASFPSRRAIVWRYNLHGRRLATDVLQRWLFGGVAHIALQSGYSATRLRTDSPWLRRRPTSHIPNGFDLEALRPDPARAAAFRARHGVSPDTPLVVTPTGAALEKALPVAQEAMQLLCEGRSIAWAVAAEVPVAREDSLQVLPLGALPVETLHDLIRAADVVLLPAPGELFNNVAAEAMALGAVVVGADTGATPEVIGDAGALFRAGDPHDAAAVIAGLLADPARREALGRAARERIATHYPLSRMEAGFDALIRSV